MSRVSAFRPPVNGRLVNMADTILDAQLATERGHKAGLAAAASSVEATIHEIDGRWPQRSEDQVTRIVTAISDRLLAAAEEVGRS